VIRPDDYNASTNTRVWKLYQLDQTSFSNPMTTSGDIIYGGASGTATRLAKGTDGQILKLSSGIPSWANESVQSPVPDSSATQSGASYSVLNSDIGTIILMDTSSNNVAVAIQEHASYSYTAGAHFWVTCVSASNAATVSFSGSTTVNGQSSPISVAHGTTLHFWRESNDSWFIL